MASCYIFLIDFFFFVFFCVFSFLPRSQVLDISKNALAEVPDAISGLKALITLDLSVNPLGTSNYCSSINHVSHFPLSHSS